MKIAFFTENGFLGKVPRDFENMRTEFAWMVALSAANIPYNKIDTITDTFDLGIAIIPKSNTHNVLRNLQSVKSRCKTFAIMQEGPRWGFQDWPVETQVLYINHLSAADFVLAHNHADMAYYKGLLGREEVHVMTTLMIEDAINVNELITDYEQRSGVMIGGNFVSWYGGFDSYSIASEMDELIYAPSMGRKQPGEDMIENINYLPYMSWTRWMTELSKRKYGVHLMRTHAAGTFSLNCARLGIPCIGYKGLDTQTFCHPELCIADGDLLNARAMAHKLTTDKKFYDMCSTSCKERYQVVYSEAVFKHEMEVIFQMYV